MKKGRWNNTLQSIEIICLFHEVYGLNDRCGCVEELNSNDHLKAENVPHIYKSYYLGSFSLLEKVLHNIKINTHLKIRICSDFSVGDAWAGNG